MPPCPDVTIRRAQGADIETVLAVLDEAAAWLRQRGVCQWPAAFRRDWVEPHVAAGEFWLAERGDVAAATLSLSWADSLWPDDRRAGYLHRLAVRRRFSGAGLGRRLLDWAARRTAAQPRPLLRLDCAADNAALRRYYQAAGFVHRGDVDLPETAAVRSAPGKLIVSRYERPVAPTGPPGLAEKHPSGG